MHDNSNKMQIASDCEIKLDSAPISTFVIGNKKDDGSSATDFPIYGAVLFASLADSKTSENFTIYPPVEVEEITEDVYEDVYVDEKESESTCESAVLEFVDKWSYESLFTV